MASLPPLLPTPLASLKLRDTDAVESRAPRRHRPLEPEDSRSRRHREPSPPPSSRRRAGRTPPPPPSKARRRSKSPPPSKVHRRSRSPSPSNVRRRSRSPPPSEFRRRSKSPPPSKVRRRFRSPPYVSSTQRLAERQHAKRPSADAAVEGERASARPSSVHESSVENRPSHSHRNCKHPETSSAAVEKRPDPAIRGAEQKLDCEKMDRKNQSDGKAPSRSARRKKMKRQIRAEAKKEMREMKKDKPLENIKKLQACVWVLENDGADMAEIMEFRSMLESTKKQYVENEAQLAKEGSSASLQVLKRDRLEKTAVPERNELVEEVNHLKSELETVRRDRDDQLAQAQSLMADVAKQKEVARRYGIELEDAMMRIAALEKGCLLRREMIYTLQIQLASANEKLTVPSPTRDLMPT